VAGFSTRSALSRGNSAEPSARFGPRNSRAAELVFGSQRAERGAVPVMLNLPDGVKSLSAFRGVDFIALRLVVVSVYRRGKMFRVELPNLGQRSKIGLGIAGTAKGD